MRTAKPVVAGLLALLALLAVFCVVDQDTLAHESVAKSDKTLVGNDLLESQASALNQARALKNKGRDMASIDEMVKGFQHPKEDKALTAALRRHAPKKSEFNVGLAPDRFGIIHPPKHAEKKKSSFSLDSLNLLQDSVTDWIPNGQDELDERIAIAEAKAKAEEDKNSGLSGSSVLSAGGITDDEDLDLADSRDLVFLQMPSSSDDSTDWVPKGQSGLDSQIQAAHAAEAVQQEHDDGIKGNTILSAAGFDDSTAHEGFDFNDLELVQASATWTPKGQSGLSQAISNAQQADAASRDAADGIKGSSILSAAGLSEDTPETLLIQEHVDHVRSWVPKGQERIRSKVRHFAHHKPKPKKHPVWHRPQDDGLDGDDILSAVSLGHVKKKDPAVEYGMLKDSDFDASALLRD